MYKYKKKILIDLDGVLNNYDGCYDEENIPHIKDGAEDFLKELNKTAELYLFTSRNLLTTSKWLQKNRIDIYFNDITNIKIPAFLYIDDRAINFEGDYKSILKEINEFKPYWSKLPKKNQK